MPHVLVVDDDAIIGQLIVRMVSQKGFSGIFIGSSQQTLEAFTQGYFVDTDGNRVLLDPAILTLVISDYEMPVLNGLAFCKAFCSQFNVSPNLLIVSGLRPETDGIAFMAKPLQMEKFHAYLGETLNA